MLAVLILNTGGYFILFRLLEVKADRQMAARIEKGEIRDDERMEVKFSFELPYPVYDQEIELSTRVASGDQVYSILGQTYEDNTLTIVGVRDQWAMHVNSVLEAFQEAAANSNDDGLVHGIGTLLQTFVNSEPPLLIQSDSWTLKLSKPPVSQDLAEGTCQSLVKPPCA